MPIQKLIANKTDWNLKLLFESDKDPQIEIDKELTLQKATEFADKWAKRTDYLESSTVLSEALDDYEQLLATTGFYGKAGYYFFLRTSQDSEDPYLKAQETKTNELATKVANLLNFFTISISKIPKAKQEEFLKDQRLSKYQFYLNNLFQLAEHILSEKEENILNSLSFHSEKWSAMTQEFLSSETCEITDYQTGEKKKVSFSELMGFLSDKNQKTRDEASVHFNQIINKHLKVAEHELNAILQDKKVKDELRGYTRPDEERLKSDSVPTDLLDGLLNSVTEKFEIARQYYRLKADLMGKTKLVYHERNVPYGDLTQKYSFQDGVDLLSEVLSGLHPEFYQILKDYIENEKIDVYPKKGKRGGAFMTGNTGRINQPTYVFLNWTSKLSDVQTFAHEIGHAINFEMMKKTENALNWDSTYLIMESPSTFLEDFVLQNILSKTSGEELRLTILMNKLNDDISTVFRQIALYNFELELHREYRKSGYLSASEIGHIFQKHMSAYMGDSVEQSPGAENWWTYWMHIRYMFYVYSYSSGLLISKFMQKEYKKDKNFMKNILEFYQTGRSKSPEKVLSDTLGINLSTNQFWVDGISEVEATLKEATDLAKKLGKI